MGKTPPTLDFSESSNAPKTLLPLQQELNRLQLLMRQEMTEAEQILWHEELLNQPLEKVRSVFRSWVRNGNKFLPTLGDVIRQVSLASTAEWPTTAPIKPRGSCPNCIDADGFIAVRRSDGTLVPYRSSWKLEAGEYYIKSCPHIAADIVDAIDEKG